MKFSTEVFRTREIQMASTLQCVVSSSMSHCTEYESSGEVHNGVPQQLSYQLPHPRETVPRVDVLPVRNR